VLDHGLPDRDGIETARTIMSAFPQTRIVMLTGSGAVSLHRRAGEVGCVGFLTKDRVTSELVDALRGAVAGRPMSAPPASMADHGDLTDREVEILEGIVRGLDNRAIAAELFLSVHTVRNHMQRLLAKLRVHSKLEAAAIAHRFGVADAS
jgi:DNA-binding NarL/FixJ family response regulator